MTDKALFMTVYAALKSIVAALEKYGAANGWLRPLRKDESEIR